MSTTPPAIIKTMTENTFFLVVEGVVIGNVEFVKAQMVVVQSCKLPRWKNTILETCSLLQVPLSIFYVPAVRYLENRDTYHWWPMVPAALSGVAVLINILWLLFETNRAKSKFPGLHVTVPWLKLAPTSTNDNVEAQKPMEPHAGLDNPHQPHARKRTGRAATPRL